MPSVFDILGILSFAQGGITLFAAGILAFRVSTEQLRDNMGAFIGCRRRYNSLLDGYLVTIKELAKREDTKAIETKMVETKMEMAETKAILAAVEGFISRKWYARWLRSADERKLIEKLSSHLSRAETKMAEARLTIVISKAVDEALYRAVLAPTAPQDM
ncbi:hypothetical protein C8R44DRAFT_893679 [Mycena epipterygia]|nr:hypothetical protein C8R44DRAFT_893679 [Mycena epipterygia]